MPNCKPISVGRPGDLRYTTPSHHPTTPCCQLIYIHITWYLVILRHFLSARITAKAKAISKSIDSYDSAYNLLDVCVIYAHRSEFQVGNCRFEPRSYSTYQPSNGRYTSTLSSSRKHAYIMLTSLKPTFIQ